MKNIVLFFVFLFFMEGMFVDTDEEKSVTEGVSVTLKSGLTEIPKDEVLEWRFGAERERIARINKAAGVSTLFDNVLDGRFKDRLKLDDQTGSLTITHTTTEHTGVYEVSTTIKPYKRTFSVIVVSKPVSGSGGLSPGGIAGIVVTVIVAVAAAGGGGGYYYLRKGQML